MSKIKVYNNAGFRAWNMGGMEQGPRGEKSIQMLERLLGAGALEHVTVPERQPGDLQLVHTPEYVYRVVAQGRSGEWDGQNHLQASLARDAFSFTMQAVRDKETRVHWLPWGAKHHAMADHSSGFCVFADWAAGALVEWQAGGSPVLIDTDAHHGDGSEELLREHRAIPTYSIHQFGIFPGTGGSTNFMTESINFPLEAGDGDFELLRDVRLACDHAMNWKPSLVLWAIGGDGHKEDPLASLEYTVEGMFQAGQRVGQLCRETGARLVMGGAGGYRPESWTPAMYAAGVVGALEEI